MKDYYSDIASGYDKLHGEEQMKKLKLIEKNFKPKAPLLDIGAGTGIAIKFFNVGGVALDPSEGLLRHYDGKKVVGGAEYLPFPDKTFNSIVSLTALHHVKDIDKAIREIKRVSKDGCNYAFSILKKANNFNELKSKLKKYFDLIEIDEEKDLILVSRTCC
ncbi:MAG: methyltransferase domain-containing protein [Candidatus Woesearchaeota archaeon]